VRVVTNLVGRRVLVVGINYDPEHTGIAPYTTQACEHLEAIGAELLVLTGVPHYPHWRTPAEYRRRLRVDEMRRGVSVRRLWHYVPPHQTALTRSGYELTFGLHVLAQRLPWRPDVVLAVVPSLFGAAAASSIARRTGARLVVWVQDLMGPATAQSGIAGGSRLTATTSALERKVLRRADTVLVLNDAFQRYVCNAGVPPARVKIVANWSHVGLSGVDVVAARERLGWGIDQVVALHSGNMGLKQGLENIVEAARLAVEKAPHVRFVLMGDGSQRTALERLGAGLPTLQILPPVPSEEFVDVLCAADVLLVNERASAVDMSLPSKLTSYFQAGGSVLAAVPAGGGTACEVIRSGAGNVVSPDDPAALLAGVVALVADSGRLQTFRDAARTHAHRHLDAASGLSRIARVVGGGGVVTNERDAFAE
jgi:glycosyltransferase involved in cell wall biosynthesis